MRKAVVFISLGGILFLIGWLFWSQEVVYLRPTPVPQDHIEPSIGTIFELPFLHQNAKPSLVHFYNPNCPCSRFNYDHFATLVREFEDSVNIYVVVQQDLLKEGQFTELKERFGPSVALHADTKERVAKSFGVYATPQAVVLDQHAKLFFKGNYNKARFCTNPETYFAKQALTALLLGEEPPEFPEMALTTYGCQLNRQKTFFDFFNLK